MEVIQKLIRMAISLVINRLRGTFDVAKKAFWLGLMIGLFTGAGVGAMLALFVS